MPHLRDALRIEPVSEKRQRYSFDTLRGGRLLPLRYVLQLLQEVQRDLGSTTSQYWLVSEAWPSWFEPMVGAFPELNLLTSNPLGEPECRGPTEDAAAQRSISRTLDSHSSHLDEDRVPIALRHLDGRRESPTMPLEMASHMRFRMIPSQFLQARMY